MHREAVRMLLADPALAEKAIATIKRWDGLGGLGVKPLRDRWVEIISARDWSAALEESEQGDQLRKASPMGTLLPDGVRLAIIRQVRMEVELKKAKAEK